MSKTQKSYKTFEWINLVNPSIEELESVGGPFKLDVNLMEDSLEFGHLPKIEKAENYTFIILRAYSADLNDIVTTVSQLTNKIAFFISQKMLVTIHRSEFEFLKKPYDSAQDPEGLMLDIINDMILSYEKPLQVQSENMDEFEKAIFLRNANTISIKSLYFQKSKARITRRVLHLTQNVLNQMTVSPRLNSNLQDLKETTLSYLLQYDEIVEEAQSILNSYLSITAQKSNGVMKLLTVFSAFFLPLTFIVGVYGMNFENMPELTWHYGYFYTLALMAIISLIIYFWFRRKKIL